MMNCRRLKFVIWSRNWIVKSLTERCSFLIFLHDVQERASRGCKLNLPNCNTCLPRLVGLRASLGRQGGGTGGGLQNKGAGETKLELDRRKIEDQIAKLGRDLDHVKDQRETQRKQRKKSGIPVVSIVGYTNAGKSTIDE